MEMGLCLSPFPDRGIVLVSKQSIDQEQQGSLCHYCRGRLPDGRVLGGGPGEPKHFCSLYCYDKWACAPVGRRAAA